MPFSRFLGASRKDRRRDWSVPARAASFPCSFLWTERPKHNQHGGAQSILPRVVLRFAQPGVCERARPDQKNLWKTQEAPRGPNKPLWEPKTR